MITSKTQIWKNRLKLVLETSHSPGVANATGTVTTKPNEIKTNTAVNKVIIIYIYLKIFYIDDLKIDIIINYLFLRLIIQLPLGLIT